MLTIRVPAIFALMGVVVVGVGLEGNTILC